MNKSGTLLCQLTKLLTRLVLWALFLLLMVIAVPWDLSYLFQAIWILLTGWAGFLDKNLPQANLDADILVTGFSVSSPARFCFIPWLFG